MDINPDATIADSATAIMGVSHITLSVRNLSALLDFYQRATGFVLWSRDQVGDSAEADRLYGTTGVEYEIAVLKAPNMLFELVEFKHNVDEFTQRMPFQGPGMTHTCFQSAAGMSGYEHFRDLGADILSRGDAPVDLGGYGVTYAYGYDMEGNMFEMEQLDEAPLATVPDKGRWISAGHRMWMTQVALVTHDIERLTRWYQEILGFAPYRNGEFANHPRMEDIVDYDGLSLLASWFRMDKTTKTLEIWQYRDPQTLSHPGKRDVTGLGYSFSLEVSDIQAEFSRMSSLGVEFVSDPVLLGDSWQAHAHDIDGNVFTLRQWLDADAPCSLRNPGS